MRLPLRLPILFAALLGIVRLLPAAEIVPTVVSSDHGEMVSTPTESTFTFQGNVVVTGTNLKITCDKLVVVANRTPDQEATIGEQERFRSLVATGNVRIAQSDREAFCERAEVFPGEDRVVLTGNPRVQSVDGEYIAEGPELWLHRGQRRAEIRGGRTKITLPAIKDLGYDQDAEKAEASDTQK